MTEPLNEAKFERLQYLLKGNKEAIKLIIDLLFTAHLWDDLIDKDCNRSDEEIHAAFLKAFRDIPLNPFYMQWRFCLEPMVVSAAMQYRDSTKLEQGDSDDRLCAFIIRNAVLGIIHYCVFLVGGPEWIDEHGPEVWRLFGLHDKYQEFLTEQVEGISDAA